MGEKLVKPGPSKGKQKLKQERVGAPFKRVAIDLIGPLPLSRQGKKYLVVMQDCFTQCIEVDAVATKKTIVVAQAFVNTCVSRYGPYGRCICRSMQHTGNRQNYHNSILPEE
jgi:hypothetical protein